MSPGRRILCIVYVSEGIRKSVISQLRSTASLEGILAHSFTDATYGRTSFYLLEGDLVQRITSLCQEACSVIDFRQHQGSHPALGSVDHVCFSPVGPGSSIDDAKEVALKFAKEISSKEQLPVYLYGEASSEKARLRDVRRELGYFSFPSKTSPAISTSTGALEEAKLSFMEHLEKQVRDCSISPSFGSRELFSASKGIMCVGVVPYVQNFNMKFRITDTKKSVMQVTKAIRSPTVEALTLQHDDGAYEVACNLLQPLSETTEIVLAAAQRAAEENGVEIVSYYTTGPSESELLELLATNTSAASYNDS